MKHQYSILILCAVLLLSSCTLEKRRYTSGYHVDWKSRVETAEKKASPSIDNTNAPAVIAEETAEVITASEPEITQSTPQPIVVAPAAVKAEKKQAEKKATSSKKTFSFESLDSPSASVHHLNTGKMAQLDAADAGSNYDMIVLIILAIFIPPLAVYLHQGSWNTACWINLVLTLLFWLPGVIHAFIVILA